MTMPQGKSNSSKTNDVPPRRLLVFLSSFCLLSCFLIALTLAGCATSEETSQLRRSTNSISYELEQFREEMNNKLSAVTKEQESLRKQFITLSSASENKDDKMRTILGRMDELEHQLQTYWKDTKSELTILKAEALRAQTPVTPKKPPKQDNSKYETVYKEAFEAFQKGSYEEAADKFSGFISAFPGNPLVANAYYWLGESYMGLGNYEKAIVTFQEVVDKYPTTDKTSRALLSQADAFAKANDEKSSIIILKKVIELYPKTEEATIAERRLRNLGLR